ncbi:GTP-binding protein [Collichthys lucidus]|uniref:GTP-binding protein n=1 Tax=Collichthys lucidus TaxID=240159 RepID=A0A4U5VSW2_COLLU|nr:GTP-binding protein [Collichthys lucidus]
MELKAAPLKVARCGENVTLTCEATIKKSDIVSLSFACGENKTCKCEDSQTNPEVQCESTDESPRHRLNLTLINVMPVNQGNYTCKLRSIKGVDAAKTRVAVKECLGSSNSSTNQSDVTCWFDGVYPVGIIHWFQGDVNLTASTTTRKEQDQYGRYNVSSTIGLKAQFADKELQAKKKIFFSYSVLEKKKQQELNMSFEVKEKKEVRLVFLGAAGVGKTALIQRFLKDTFEPKHRRTVEELHKKEYEVRGVKVTINIMDTSGSYSFPAMRKLSIQNSDAFALVYAVDDPESLEAVKSLREEILEVKEDKYTPIVVIGNKIDRHNERRVSSDDVLSTVELDWNNSFLESSAKDNVNVLEAFRELLQQANLPSWLSPALCRRRETFPKKSNQRPPMNKTNSCLIS